MKTYKAIVFLVTMIVMGLMLQAEKHSKKEAKRLGYEYTPHLIIPDRLEDFDLMPGVEQAYKEDNPELYHKFAPVVDDALLAPLYIKKISDEVGHGAFAAEDLPKGTVIGEYTGVLHHERYIGKIEDTSYVWDIDDRKLLIDARTHGNELRFVNHSKNSNVSVEFFPYKSWWHIMYVTSELIKKDLQLLVDYGGFYSPKGCEIIELQP